MGYNLVTASKSVFAAQHKLTSVIMTGHTGQLSATITLYNATAATADTEVMVLACGTAPKTVTWHDPIGINVDNLYAVITCGNATIVWD